MENWTEGQWLEWLDKRRDGTGFEPPAIPSKVTLVHEIIDWTEARSLKWVMFELLRKPTSWQLGMLTETRCLNPREEAIKHLFINYLSQ